MYVMEVRHAGILIYKATSVELSDIVKEMIDWCNDAFAQYVISIYEIPRMVVEVTDE